MKYKLAKRYIEIGWSIIPIKENSKIPAIKDVVQYRTRYATDEELQEWFIKNNFNIALITGKLSRITVIDDDSIKNSGISSDLIKKANSSVETKTANGGRHLFCKYEEGFGNKVNIQGNKIDIRTEGGYVLIPDSSINGKKYEWISHPTKENLSKMPLLSQTTGVYEALKNQPKGVLENVNILLNLSEGSRNDALFKLARGFLNRLTLEQTFDLVLSINNNYKPPLSKYEVETIVKQANRYFLADKKIISKEPKKIKEISRIRILEKEKEKEAVSTGYPELDNIIKGFIPGHIYTVTGETNIGKSSVACNFVNAIRKQGKKSLYIALEPESTIVDYLASTRLEKPFSELTNEDISYDDDMVDIYGKEEIQNVDDLIKVIKETTEEYALVVVDHIGYFIQDKANYLQEQSNVIKKLAGLSKSKHVAIMIIAHLRKRMKNEKKDYTPTADDISGSGSFKQDSTEVIIITRKMISEDKDEIVYGPEGTMYVVKTKCGPNGKFTLLFTDRVAKIGSYGQSSTDKLTLMGFPDQKKLIDK